MLSASWFIISRPRDRLGGGCDGGAFAQMLQAAVDPEFGKLALHAVLRQAATQGAEIDAIHLLVLIEAGEHHRLGAGHRVMAALQALRTDLLYHALHRRVDLAPSDLPRDAAG